MSYQVKQGNLLGRIGSGFGEGLAGQLPKEVERNRLHGALTEIGNNPNQTLFQQFAALAAAPGSTPQIQQTGGELLKQMAVRQGYKNANQQYRGQEGQPGEAPQLFGQEQQPQQMARQYPNQQAAPSPAQAKQIIPSDFASRAAEVASVPPAARENPLQQKYLPPPAWNQQMHEREINNAFDRGIARDFNEANAYANQQRQFYEAAPEAERAKLNYQKEIDQETDKLFDNQLATRLEKTGEGTYKDVPGDIQLEMKKHARNKVATGQMTPEQAAEFFSKGAHDLARSQSEFKSQANRDLADRILPSKKDRELKRLKEMSQQFAEYGASEMFYNMLQNQNKDENGNKEGFGLSPGAAALIAYPRSEGISKIIQESKIPLITFDPVKSSQASKAIADKVLNGMTSRDSILAIAKELKDKHPLGFDETAFFDYISDHPELYKYNPRLSREMLKRESDLFPNWGDLSLFPIFSPTSAAHKR